MHRPSPVALSLFALLSSSGTPARAATEIQGLPGQEPRAVLASPAGGFVLVYGDRVVR